MLTPTQSPKKTKEVASKSIRKSTFPLGSVLFLCLEALSFVFFSTFVAVMKKRLSNIILSLIALLVFYGGAGINIVSFCCNECRDGGIEVVLGSSCCEVHGHSHTTHAHPANFDSESHGHSETISLTHGQCGMMRVGVDWLEVINQHFSFQPSVLELFTDLYAQLLFVPLTVSDAKHTLSATIPPRLTPRGYLSILSTLLI